MGQERTAEKQPHIQKDWCDEWLLGAEVVGVNREVQAPYLRHESVPDVGKGPRIGRVLWGESNNENCFRWRNL